ncbi:Kelch domain-containing protein 10 [Thelohanellus kitauei]|uniref:Kelch domain-containing protein 10 n=1 Tax=Thelohanellus kitauei TaxID=669202 RepID=A0A0C2MV21_THEKT|nr:Kelch domain-containing protein 10 [Thelohanellus kitauei]
MSEPESRSNHCITSAREYLIIYGGQSEISLQVLKELWTYNTLGGIWKRYQIPTEITIGYLGSSVCSVDNTVYIFGGSSTATEDRVTNSLISFNVRNHTWQTLSPHIDDFDENTLPPLIYSWIFYHNKSIYILGGIFDDDLIITMYKFCLNTSTWSVVEQNGVEPFPLTRMYGTVFKNQFCTFSGRAENVLNRFMVINIFDLSTNTWSKKETKSNTQEYPDDRDEESYAFSKNVVYLSGGQSGRTSYTDIWKFDFENLEWCKLDYTLQKGMYIHSTSVVDDTYLYSYNAEPNKEYITHLLERFTIRPPTLYRQCLEKISISPNLRDCISSLPTAIADELNFHNTD